MQHPSEWVWTGWLELMSQRKRNRFLDVVLEAPDVDTVEAFRAQHRVNVEDALARRQLERESPNTRGQETAFCRRNSSMR